MLHRNGADESDELCCRLGEVCAIVSGVKSPEDMAKASVKSVSRAAEAIGCRPGMTGDEVLILLDAHRPMPGDEALAALDSLKSHSRL